MFLHCSIKCYILDSMPRVARIVVPGLPHHVVQRGNRRQQTFFHSADYERYIDLVREACRRTETEVWAWCLMPNHVHLLLVPAAAEALSEVMGTVHQSYAWVINRRQGWQGCLWQGRYFSDSVNMENVAFVARYIELNPFRARMTPTPEAWPWSSAGGRLAKVGDRLARGVQPAPFVSVGDWRAYLAEGMCDVETRGLGDGLGTGT
jgi:putative transposase